MSSKKLQPVYWWDVRRINDNLLPYEPDPGLNDRKTDVALLRRYKAGAISDAGELPDRFLYRKDFDGMQRNPLPPVIDAGGFIVLNQALHDVLVQFDLGGAVLHPVKLFQIDHTTEEKGNYYIPVVVARKRGFEPEHSKNVRYPRAPEPNSHGRLGLRIVEDDVRMNTSVLTGADLWMDPGIFHEFFISDRLCQAIKAANLLAPTRAIRCPIVPLH